MDGWARIEELFAKALALAATERAALLDSECADEPSLRARVVELLAAADSRTEFLSPPTLPSTGLGGEVPLLGETVGSARLDRLIAEGGMGAVYEGWQKSLRRHVAVKLMRWSCGTGETRRRFEYEAKVLARLRHPNIAEIYEYGVHEVPGAGQGLPYFIMELVPNAHPLTAFAQQRSLDLRQRLELMNRVCLAVQYGHQQGIIHRDLKPANVLVDDSGDPKVIDFGLALSTEDSNQGRSFATEQGIVVGTVRYMSPEQIGGTQEGVDTRTDVYALGVMLYELLCGHHPYFSQEVVLAEAARVITETPAVRPSKIDPRLRGDIETIVLKALAKDREERYASPDALAEDVRRFLESEPILARPPTLGYQLRLLARRHRAVVAGMLVAAISLLTAAGISVWFAVSADAARGDAERARHSEKRRADDAESLLKEAQAFTRWVLRDMGPRLGQLPGATDLRKDMVGRIVTYLETLDRAVQNPALQSSLADAWTEVALIQGGPRAANLGLHQEALKSLDRGITLHRKANEHRSNHPEFRFLLMRVSIVRGDLLAVTGSLDQARATYEEALAELGQLLGRAPTDPDILRFLAHAERGLATLARMQSDTASAQQHALSALGWLERAVSNAPTVVPLRDALWSERIAVAQDLTFGGKFDEAQSLLDATKDELQDVGRELPRPARLVHEAALESARAELEFGRYKTRENAEGPGFPGAGEQLGNVRAHHQRALVRLEKAVESDPNNASLLRSLAHSLVKVAAFSPENDRPDLLERNLAVEEQLLRLSPESHNNRLRKAMAFSALGRALHLNGRATEARDFVAAGLRINEELVQVNPGPQENGNLAQLLMLHGEELLIRAEGQTAADRRAHVEAAMAALDRARIIMESIHAKDRRLDQSRSLEALKKLRGQADALRQ